jgi:hypothetical protein
MTGAFCQSNRIGCRHGFIDFYNKVGGPRKAGHDEFFELNGTALVWKLENQAFFSSNRHGPLYATAVRLRFAIRQLLLCVQLFLGVLGNQSSGSSPSTVMACFTQATHRTR